MPKHPRKPAPFPTREAVLEFIRQSAEPVGKREVTRAFQLDRDAKVALGKLLKDLGSDGSLERGRGRRLAPAKVLPEMAVLVVYAVSGDGEVLARLDSLLHDDGTPPPVIYMRPEPCGHPSLTVGDRVLARLRRLNDREYEGRTVRRLEGGPERVVGIYRECAEGGRIAPTDRRARAELTVALANAAGTLSGELVLAELMPGSRHGLRPARVLERLGHADEPRTISLIAIHAAGLPTVFPAAALEECKRALVPTADNRADLRSVPLLTIDGADARDFDDAVAAWPDSDGQNPGGWHLVVAIADVAHYVRPGSALDRAAFDRGNSVYFPDRVVPMLPEALSNDLCSLKPDEDRACFAVHLCIDRDGNGLRHRFERGLMRSRARLTYEQVQLVHDAATNGGIAPSDIAPLDIVPLNIVQLIPPLYGAFQALAAARARRGTLELELPERQVLLDAEGRVAEIITRTRYDSHRLIEEFMIAANVAAAEALERAGTPLLYRIHDRPSLDKLENLRQFLSSIGLRLARGHGTQPAHFTQILKLASDLPDRIAVNEMVLRSQAQAEYNPDNIGHFGLALPRYAHFTSPIRRYADLIVHRALIRALGLGAESSTDSVGTGALDGLDDATIARLVEIGVHLSRTERRAAAAERDATDRFIAAFLADRVGATFEGRICGVTRFGLFVRLEDSGADGLVPIRSLPNDYYDHVETLHALIGRRTGLTFRLGSQVRIRLLEANPLTASTLFELAEGGDEGWVPCQPRGHGRGATAPRKTGKKPATLRPRR
ncbi:MAG: ribonuclease R [Rhodospirillaceae bacterium]